MSSDGTIRNAPDGMYIVLYQYKAKCDEGFSSLDLKNDIVILIR